MRASAVLVHPPHLKELAKRLCALTERPGDGPAAARLHDLQRRLTAGLATERLHDLQRQITALGGRR